jgi:hypothetical protein
VNGESPGNYVYLADPTPELSWEPVTLTSTTVHYRVQIMDWKSMFMVFQSHRFPETTFTIPSGLLIPGNSYRIRIRATDAATGDAENNISSSDWRHVTMLPVLGDVDCNGIVDLADLMIVLQMLTDMPHPDICFFDADGNFRIGMAEALLIMRYLAEPGS